MNEKLVQLALDEYDAKMKSIGACTDGYCVVGGRRSGMHTNGGCRCAMNPSKAQLLSRAARQLRDALEGAKNR